MLDRVAGKERDAIVRYESHAVQKTSGTAHEVREFRERDGACIFHRHDVWLVRVKPCGAIDPRPDESGAGIMRCGIVHLSLISRRLASRKFAA